MGRFGGMIGVKEFDIGGQKIELRAKAGDNMKLLKVMSIPESERMEAIHGFCVDLMVRNYPQEPKEDIEVFVEYNIMAFMKEILISFGWTTKADWESKQGDMEKKLMSGA